MRIIFGIRKMILRFNLLCLQSMRSQKLRGISKELILFLILKTLCYQFRRENSSNNFSKQTSFRLEFILKSLSRCHPDIKRNQNLKLHNSTQFITHLPKDLFMSRTLNSLQSKVMPLITSRTVQRLKEIYLPLPIDSQTYR